MLGNKILLVMSNFFVKDELTVSLQDYLEAIGVLLQTNRFARVKDIASKLNVKLASVSVALKQLRDKGFVDYTPYGSITLTRKGEEFAGYLISTHNLFEKLFTEVFCFEKEEANKISCVVEHYISKSSIEKIKKFIEFKDECKLLKSALELFPEYLKKQQYKL